MLEHHLFFGVLAIRKATEDAYIQARFFEENPGKAGRDQQRKRKANCKSARMALGAILVILAVDAPVKLNETLAAYSELPSRLMPVIEPAAFLSKRLLPRKELLALPAPATPKKEENESGAISQNSAGDSASSEGPFDSSASGALTVHEGAASDQK
jgi:hypothetical protein